MAKLFDASGKLTEFPVITVRHNGKLIHHEQVLGCFCIKGAILLCLTLIEPEILRINGPSYS